MPKHHLKKSKSKVSKRIGHRIKPVNRKALRRFRGSGLKSINKKIDKVLDVEKNILLEERHVEEKEQFLSQEEEKIEQNEEVLKNIEKESVQAEKRQEVELKKLEQLEQDIRKEVGTHPLMQLGYKDFFKGLVGAFAGLAVHYTFVYGVKISENLSMARATSLFILSFIIGMIFIYVTGFRKIKDPKILMFVPIRLIVLYLASIVMSLVVLLIFYPTFGVDFQESYKMTAGVILAAVVGACTADLIGKE